MHSNSSGNANTHTHAIVVGWLVCWLGGWLGFNGMYRDTPRSSVQTRLNRSRCRLGRGLAWAQGIMCYMGVQSPHGKEQFWWLGTPIVNYTCHCNDDCSREPVCVVLQLCNSHDRPKLITFQHVLLGQRPLPSLLHSDSKNVTFLFFE